MVNQKGIEYYKELINGLISNDITPIITLYHWDLPQVLQDLGGWANPLIVDWFEDYARVVFTNLGNKVRMWLTFNEPKQVCKFGYRRDFLAPGIESSGLGEYLCVRNVAMAHTRVYHLYKDSFRTTQKGNVSIVNECPWKEPASNSTEDQEAAERVLQFDLGLYANAIFSEDGNFPTIVKTLLQLEVKLKVIQDRDFPFFLNRKYITAVELTTFSDLIATELIM